MPRYCWKYYYVNQVIQNVIQAIYYYILFLISYIIVLCIILLLLPLHLNKNNVPTTNKYTFSAFGKRSKWDVTRKHFLRLSFLLFISVFSLNGYLCSVYTDKIFFTFSLNCEAYVSEFKECLQKIVRGKFLIEGHKPKAIVQNCDSIKVKL